MLQDVLSRKKTIHKQLNISDFTASLPLLNNSLDKDIAYLYDEVTRALRVSLWSTQRYIDHSEKNEKEKSQSEVN